MPVLTPELVAEKTPFVATVVNAIRRRVRVPAWAVTAIILMVALAGFAAGRSKPKHHYVPYFGNMVVDTNTGKACYVTQPRSADADADGSALYPIDGTVTRTDLQQTTGPDIPVCGKQ